jgi:transcriptional antiterminator RfaH
MSIAALDDHARWYAIRTKPREEDRVDINLRNWQVQTFTPKLKELRTSGYGGEYVCKPLFASYIFARFDASRQLHDINYTRGVQNVVSFGGSPISIDDKVINLLRARVAGDGFIQIDEELKLGDKVRINSGPFESLVGIFKRRTKDKDRVRILLDAMTYQSHLLIDGKMVEKVN